MDKPYSIEDYSKAQDVLQSLMVGTEKKGRDAALEFAIQQIQVEINLHYYGK